MLSLAQRLAARIEELERWDDGGGMILDREAGGRIVSYTGVHGWNRGAGHTPPPIEPALRAIREELEAEFDQLSPEQARQLRDDFIAHCETFDQSPSIRTLTALAGVIDEVRPLYQNVRVKYDLNSSYDDADEEYPNDEDE